MLLAFSGIAFALVCGGLGAATSVIGLLGGVTAFIQWVQKITRRRPVSTPDQLDSAVRQLAQQIATEWGKEARNRQLGNGRPLAVRWSPRSGDIACHLEPTDRIRPGQADKLSDLVDDFTHAGRRLVLLGPDESGKSDLGVLLTQALLASRRDGDPVPVLLSAASWDCASEDTRAWLRRRLAEDYPSLTNTDCYGTSAIPDLIELGRVYPIIDGLDELPNTALAIDQLNRTYGREDALVVTCRTEDYRRAVADSDVITAAPVIELQPVQTADAIGFLTPQAQAGPRTERWRPVFEAMRRTRSPIAVAMSSALMVSLARDVYQSPAAQPAQLLRFPDHESVTDHLLGSLVPTWFARRSSGPGQWRAEQAVRWLTFLAVHMDRLGTRDLAWWQLRHALPALRSGRRAMVPALIAWPVTGVLFGFAKALSADPLAGLVAGGFQGLDVALIVGSAYLFETSANPTDPRPPLGLGRLPRLVRTPVVAALCGAAYAVESGIRDGVERGAVAGVKAGLINWVLVALVAGLAIASGMFTVPGIPTRVSLRRPRRRSGLARALVAGAAKGGAVGIAAGYGVKLSASLTGGHLLWLLGGPAGAVIGLTFVLVAWAGTAPPAGEAVSPDATLRADRALILLLLVPLALLFAIFYGAAFGLAPHGSVRTGLRSGAYGLALGISLWLVIAFTRTWPWYLVTTMWLAGRGRLPWRLAKFLSDAHQRRILRQVGGVYQFRHARLGDHLVQADRAGTAPRRSHPAPATLSNPLLPKP